MPADLKIEPDRTDVADMQAVVLIVIVASTIWVGVDASHRDWSGHSFANATWKWVVGSLSLDRRVPGLPRAAQPRARQAVAPLQG